MEIQFKQNRIECFNEVFSNVTVSEASAECVVPDVNQDIMQILSTSFAIKLRSKDADYGHISVKANVCATVLYLSESGIEKLELELPVNAEVPVQDCDNGCSVCADMRMTSHDLRVLNPRKIALKVNVLTQIRCFRKGDCDWFAQPDELPDEMFVKNENADVELINTVDEKTFVIQEEFEPGATGEAKLLSMNATYYTDDYETVGAKLVARGRVELCGLYISEGEIKKLTYSVPFSQIFDIGGEGVSGCEMSVMSTGEYYDLSGGVLNVELHAVLQISAHYRYSIPIVSDLYSCRCETEPEYCELICRKNGRLRLGEERIALTYDAGNDVSGIVDTKICIGEPVPNGDAVRVPVTAELLYTTVGGDLFSGKLRGSADFSVNDAPDAGFLKTNITDITAVPSGTKIDVRMGVSLSGITLCSDSIFVIRAVTCGDPLPKSETSVYLVRRGEDLWTLAKRYRSDPVLIEKLNELSPDRTLLLIPRI